MRAAQRVELLRAVLADMPRVARALGAGRREREHVRRRDEHHAAGAGQLAQAPEHRPRVLDVLDRLQEHERVARLVEGLDHRAHEAQVVAHVAQPGVLVRLGVGVDADDFRRPRARHHVGAVALAAGHVDDAQPADLRGDPLVHDEMASEPVVLLRARRAACARRSAPAAARRAAGRAGGTGAAAAARQGGRARRGRLVGCDRCGGGAARLQIARAVAERLAQRGLQLLEELLAIRRVAEHRDRVVQAAERRQRA